MHKVILKLDKSFLKYEGGGGRRVKLTPSHEKLISKSPALLDLRVMTNDEVKDFVAIKLSEYFKTVRGKLYSKINEKQNLC